MKPKPIVTILMFLMFASYSYAVDYGQNLNITNAMSNISRTTEILPSETPQTYTAIKKERFLIGLSNDKPYYTQLVVVDWSYLLKSTNGAYKGGGTETKSDNVVALLNLQGLTFYDINDTLGTNITLNSTEIKTRYLLTFKTLYSDGDTLTFNLSETPLINKPTTKTNEIFYIMLIILFTLLTITAITIRYYFKTKNA